MATALPPTSSESPFTQAVRLGADPFGYLSELETKLGDTFTLRLPFDRPRVATSDPAAIRQIFALKPDEFSNAKIAFPLNIGRWSLLFLDGDEHRRHRQLMMPHLHGDRLRSYARTMQRITQRELARVRPGDVLELHELLRKVALDVVLECVFGLREGADSRAIGDPAIAWIDGVMRPQTFLVASLVGYTRVRRFLDADVDRRADRRSPALLPWQGWSDAKNRTLAALRERVERARDSEDSGDDVLSLLAHARFEDGTQMEIEAILDELATLLVGGHETTASALTWAVAQLLVNPHTLDAARDELRATFGGAWPDPTRAGELRTLDAIIKESMRLSPIAPAVTRHLVKPQRLGRWDVPADTIVWPCVALAHRRAESFPDPLRFDPARFLGETPSTNVFFPFGGGRRTCIGMAFATFEMRVVLAELLARLDLSLVVPGLPAAEIRGATIAPRKGFQVKVGAVRLPPSSATATSSSASDSSSGSGRSLRG
jgi:cytochrome P450